MTLVDVAARVRQLFATCDIPPIAITDFSMRLAYRAAWTDLKKWHARTERKYLTFSQIEALTLLQ